MKNDMTAKIKKILKAIRCCMPETAEDGELTCKDCPYCDHGNLSCNGPLLIDVREVLREVLSDG